MASLCAHPSPGAIDGFEFTIPYLRLRGQAMAPNTRFPAGMTGLRIFWHVFWFISTGGGHTPGGATFCVKLNHVAQKVLLFSKV